MLNTPLARVCGSHNNYDSSRLDGMIQLMDSFIIIATASCCIKRCDQFVNGSRPCFIKLIFFFSVLNLHKGKEQTCNKERRKKEENSSKDCDQKLFPAL